MRPPFASVDRRTWDLEWLARELGFDEIAAMSRRIAAIDRHGYTLFVDSSGGKRRVISAPREWLKDLQKRVNRGVLTQLPISDCAFNASGRGPIANAMKHVGQTYMTAVDVEDCFPSTSVAMVSKALRDLGLRESVAATLTRLTTFHGFLPQGSPASDAVLNVVFHPMDEEFSYLAKQHDAVYTRYTDDLTFSSGRPLGGLERSVPRILKGFGYRSNSAKLHVWGPRDRHIVTGVAVHPRPRPTPRFLWRLSRDLDRYESGVGGLTENQLRSSINWANDIDPALAQSFLARLDKAARLSRRPA